MITPRNRPTLALLASFALLAVGCDGATGVLPTVMVSDGVTVSLIEGGELVEVGPGGTLAARWNGNAVAAAADGTITLYDATGAVVDTFDTGGLFFGSAVHVGGNTLYGVSTASGPREVWSVDLESGALEQLADTSDVHAVSDDGSKLVVESFLLGLVLREGATETVLEDLLGFGNGCCGADFTPDASGVWGHQAGAFGTLDLASLTFTALGSPKVTGAAVTPFFVEDTGDQIIVGESTGYYYLDRTTGEHTYHLAGNPPLGNGLGISQDLRWILHSHADELAGATDYTVRDTQVDNSDGGYVGEEILEDSDATFTSGVLF